MVTPSQAICIHQAKFSKPLVLLYSSDHVLFVALLSTFLTFMWLNQKQMEKKRFLGINKRFVLIPRAVNILLCKGTCVHNKQQIVKLSSSPDNESRRELHQTFRPLIHDRWVLIKPHCDGRTDGCCSCLLWRLCSESTHGNIK